MAWFFRLLLVLFFASAGLAFASTTNKTVPKIFIKLYPEFTLESSKEREWTFQSQGKTLKLKIVDLESSKNAFAYTAKSGEQQILITSKLFDDLRSDDELAFVIAHEMSHLELEHYSLPNLSSYVLSEQQKSRISAYLQKQELLADSKAIQALKNAGFSSKQSSDLLSEQLASNQESIFGTQEKQERNSNSE